MKAIRERKACHLNPQDLKNRFTWSDIERKMRQSRRNRRNYNRFWIYRTPEGNTRRKTQERAGR